MQSLFLSANAKQRFSYWHMLIAYEFLEGFEHWIEKLSLWPPSNNTIRELEFRVGSPLSLLKAAKESNSMLCRDQRQKLAKISRLGPSKVESCYFRDLYFVNLLVKLVPSLPRMVIIIG